MRENEGNGGAKDHSEPTQKYGSREFQSLLSPCFFSNLRAVALNWCKDLSNVRLTYVVYEGENGENGEMKEERGNGRKRAEGKKDRK